MGVLRGSSRRPFAAFNLPTRSHPVDEQSWRVAARPRASGGARRCGASRRSPRRRRRARAPLPGRSARAAPRARNVATAPARRSARSHAGRALAPPGRTHTAGSSASCSGRARPRPSARKIGCGAMSRVAVVTDTTQYLPREVIERHGVELVSLYVNWAGRTDRESELGDYGAFYDHLRSSPELPSTSQPSIGDFLAVYEPLVESGADILSIHLSGDISGTVRAAEQARDALVERGVAPERLRVLDSRQGCAGQGMMAIAAANAAAGGADLEGAAAAADALRETITILFAVDTLEFLRRGGRIGAAQALLG